MREYTSCTAVAYIAGGLLVLSLAGPGFAQSSLASAGNLNVPGGAPGAGVTVGDGIHQTQPVVSAHTNSSAQPAVGVGALSGNPNHSGSTATVSVLNTNRLAGLDTGAKAGNASVSVENAGQRPVAGGLVSH